MFILPDFEEENHISEIKDALREVSQLAVEVGVILDVGSKGIEFLQMIATANEFGTDITPKNSRYLAIPTKLGLGHSPRDFKGLFVPKGKHVLAKSNNNGGLDIYFILKSHVRIPERSFLRSGLDDNMYKMADLVEENLQRVFNLEMSPQDMYERLGRQLADYIKIEIRLKMSPKNAPLTIANKGKDDPLVDKGSLLNSISYRVVEA